jgi:D-serine deaminase-like pyridoxal phosphate-dependent protein
MTTIQDLPTPALLLDVDALDRNLERMAQRARGLGVALRPHIKTHKCIEIAQRQRDLGALGLTVSTIEEARAFADHGFGDLTWAFPVSLSRLDDIRALAERSTLRLVIDSRDALTALDDLGEPLHVWLKVDCGYHRAGVDPTSALAVELAADLAQAASLTFDGILSHSGHAYYGPSPSDVLAAAREERDTMLAFADVLDRHGTPPPAISVGSTPAMQVIDHLEGITEARPGNYAFYDYTQVILGSCTVSDCAATVLSTVISSQPNANHAVCDAGALALSKDLGHDTAPHATMGEVYAEYGTGRLHDELRVAKVSQEHGILHGSPPVGSRIRILPNHSCLTVACFDRYWVVRGEEVVDEWKIWRER